MSRALRWSRVRRVLEQARTRTSRADPADQVFVIGNQKSGTTAVAALLARAAARRATLDIPPVWDGMFDLVVGKTDLRRFIGEHSQYFRAPLVKEPSLTFVLDELMEVFPDRRGVVFVVREPRDTVRSILDRLGLPGSAVTLTETQLDQVHAPAWRRYLTPNPLVPQARNHVDRLAQQWQLAAKVYDRNRDACTLVRYEDFVADKLATIHELARGLGWEIRRDITAEIDIQYQPQGVSGNVPWEAFFGEANLRLLEERTRRGRAVFGYD